MSFYEEARKVVMRKWAGKLRKEIFAVQARLQYEAQLVSCDEKTLTRVRKLYEIAKQKDSAEWGYPYRIHHMRDLMSRCIRGAKLHPDELQALEVSLQVVQQ